MRVKSFFFRWSAGFKMSYTGLCGKIQRQLLQYGKGFHGLKALKASRRCPCAFPTFLPLSIATATDDPRTSDSLEKNFDHTRNIRLFSPDVDLSLAVLQLHLSAGLPADQPQRQGCAKTDTRDLSLHPFPFLPSGLCSAVSACRTRSLEPRVHGGYLRKQCMGMGSKNRIIIP